MWDYENDPYASRRSAWQRLPPPLRAALTCSIPFIIADLVNTFSVGISLAISLPVQAVIYLGCGALAARFAVETGRYVSDFIGVQAGLILWGLSLVVNLVVALLAGIATLGITVLLGLPYICLCGPVQLVASALLGGVGGWAYKNFAGGGEPYGDVW